MYIDKSIIILESDGIIEGGDKIVGIYGYGVNLKINVIIKVGIGGIGVYFKGGNIIINGGILFVGENGVEGLNDVVGVYYVGVGGIIINNVVNVNIGNSVYGFVV